MKLVGVITFERRQKEKMFLQKKTERPTLPRSPIHPWGDRTISVCLHINRNRHTRTHVYKKKATKGLNEANLPSQLYEEARPVHSIGLQRDPGTLRTTLSHAHTKKKRKATVHILYKRNSPPPSRVDPLFKENRLK